MELEFIVRPKRDQDAQRYELHVLVDRVDGRAYGWVETPLSTELLYEAVFYGKGDRRMYLTLDAAKDYLLRTVNEQHDEECSALTKSVMDPKDAKDQVKSE